VNLRAFTLHDQIERNAWLHGDRSAFVADERRVTHAEFAARSACLAAGLASAGVAVGERVAILAPNCQAYLDLFGAAARLGAIVVPVNWRLSAQEVAYVLQDTSPRVLIAAPEFHALVPEALPQPRRRSTMTPGSSSFTQPRSVAARAARCCRTAACWPQRRNRSSPGT
jgi:acyl-CoA synthetase (AMP-forming)/AMP-acid ligase II